MIAAPKSELIRAVWCGKCVFDTAGSKTLPIAIAARTRKVPPRKIRLDPVAARRMAPRVITTCTTTPAR